MRIQNVLSAFILAVGCLLALGGTNAQASNFVWSDPRKVASVSEKDGVFSFVLEGATLAKTGKCGNKFALDANDPMLEQKKAAVNASKDKNLNLSVYFADDAEACPIGILNLKVLPPAK